MLQQEMGEPRLSGRIPEGGGGDAVQPPLGIAAPFASVQLQKLPGGLAISKGVGAVLRLLRHHPALGFLRHPPGAARTPTHPAPPGRHHPAGHSPASPDMPHTGAGNPPDSPPGGIPGLSGCRPT